MSDEDVATLRDRVAEFEDIMYQAELAQYANFPPEVARQFIEDDAPFRWRLTDVFDAYRSGMVYPSDRLPGVMDRLIDTRLQLHFVSKVMPGTVNTLVYSRGFDHEAPLENPRLQLARLCYTQAMIGQSRVLWERLMRLIYFLEEGHDPDGKSTRRRFFGDLAKWSPRWDLLAECAADIAVFDNSLRTPEYHKGSVLRKELLGGDAIDLNDILGLLTPVMSGVWPLLRANIAGTEHHIARLGHRIPRLSEKPDM